MVYTDPFWKAIFEYALAKYPEIFSDIDERGMSLVVASLIWERVASLRAVGYERWEDVPDEEKDRQIRMIINA